MQDNKGPAKKSECQPICNPKAVEVEGKGEKVLEERTLRKGGGLVQIAQKLL